MEDTASHPSFTVQEARAQNLVGNRIGEMRRARKMTQTELASRLTRMGIPLKSSAISRWESGGSEPSATELIALYKALDIEPDFPFLTGDIAEIETPLGKREARILRGFSTYLAGKQSKETAHRSVTLPCLIFPKSPVPEGFPEPSDMQETVTVPENRVPYGTDFAVDLGDKGLAFVRRTDALLGGDAAFVIFSGTPLLCRYVTYSLTTPDPSGYVSTCPLVLYPLFGDDFPIPVTNPDLVRVIGRLPAL
ncbi:MAG: helix-turn-helix transcriptional regulator [Clostridia bacterium]|nr:helix-turn-helix transcriptional regulator [Clostridia bacterium]